MLVQCKSVGGTCNTRAVQTWWGWQTQPSVQCWVASCTRLQILKKQAASLNPAPAKVGEPDTGQGSATVKATSPHRELTHPSWEEEAVRCAGLTPGHPSHAPPAAGHP